jgi:DNA-damage-inducible protein D
VSNEIRDIGQSKLFSKLESIKQRTNKGLEYWRARELQPILGYQYWQNFEEVIKRAMMSAASAGLNAENQFSATTNMVTVGSGAQRQVGDFFLTRYACYLMAMNGDPSKPEIAFAQTYCAVLAWRQ